MLQLYPVYSLWSRRKTLTGSPDPNMQTVQINLTYSLDIYIAVHGYFMDEVLWSREQKTITMKISFNELRQNTLWQDFFSNLFSLNLLETNVCYHKQDVFIISQSIQILNPVKPL